MPATASSVTFELHKIGAKYNMRIFYKKKPSDTTVAQLTFPNIGSTFSLDKFRLAYKDVIPDLDYAAECAAQTTL